MPIHPTRRRRVGAIAVLACLATLLVVDPFMVSRARAAPGDGHALLGAATADKAAALPGDTIQYSFTYSCQNSIGGGTPDGCDGAAFADPIPLFTDVYGVTTPLTFVSASGPAAQWPSGFALDSSDPAHPVVRGTAGNWAPGTSGSIFVTVTVPPNMVPMVTQAVTNTAVVTDPQAGPDSSTTASVNLSATARVWTLAQSTDPSTRLNHPVVWNLTMCAAITAAMFPWVRLTEQLPPGATFKSADAGGTYTDDSGGAPDLTSDGAGQVVWTFDATHRPPLDGGGCLSLQVVGTFTAGYTKPGGTNPANDNNVGGAVKTAVFSGVGRDTPGGASTPFNTPTGTTTIAAPVFGWGGGGVDKNIVRDADNASIYYTTRGMAVRFELMATLDSDLAADSFTVTDGSWTYVNGGSSTSGYGMPPYFAPASVVPGVWNHPLTATISGSNDNFVSSTVIAAGVVSGSASISLAIPYKSLRWTWGGGADSIPVDFSVNGMAVIGNIGTVATPTSAYGRYTNVATFTFKRGGTNLSQTASRSYLLTDPTAEPDISVNASPGSVSLGQNVSYTIRASNSLGATDDVVNPVVVACLPARFTLQPGALGTGWSAGGTAPTCSGGETPLHYAYSGSIAPGTQSNPLTVVASVDDASSPGGPAPPGDYPFAVTVVPSAGGSFATCSASCSQTAMVTVLASVNMQASICVRGDLDAGLYRPSPTCSVDPSGSVVSAQTRPGGLAQWQLRLANTGNVDNTNLAFIDLLPRVGDTAVTTGSPTLTQRGSEYPLLLTSAITAPAGWTVQYSTSTNPCRAEVGGVHTQGVDCEAPGWVSSPVTSMLTTYRAVKLAYSGTLTPGATATFSWSSRVPVNDPTFDQGGVSAANSYEFINSCAATAAVSSPTHCPRSVNSFAFGSDATNLPTGVATPPRLFSEPPSAEVRVSQAPTGATIGDLVWFDNNDDGLQAPDRFLAGEPGVAGVEVDLYQCTAAACATSAQVATTFTDSFGQYLFGASDGVAVGQQYKLRFYRPIDFIASPVNAGDDARDSDLPAAETGSDANGPYHETPPFTATAGDTSWDFGLWKPSPAIAITKVTKDTAWPDAQANDGVHILSGRPVTWMYTVTNVGNTRLDAVTVNDDGGPAASFTVTNCSVVADGTNGYGLHSSATPPMELNRGGVLLCAAAGTAGSAPYTNVGTALGAPRLDDGSIINFGTPPATVAANDSSSYTTGTYDLGIANATSVFDCAANAATVTLTVRNLGDFPSGAYQVTDVLATGTALAGAAIPTPSSATASRLVFDMPTLDPGGTAVITIPIRVSDFSVTSFANQATITADGAAALTIGGQPAPTTDSNAGNNSMSSSLVVASPGYGVALSKSVDSPLITPDANATFTVNVANRGSVAAATYTVVDTLPAGLSLVSASDSPTTANNSDGTTTLTWNLTALARGATRSLTVVAHPSDLTKRPYRNSATLTDDGASGVVGSYCPLTNLDAPHTGAATVDVKVEYDLSLIKTVVDGQTFAKGSVIGYRIAVKNQGTVSSGPYSVHDVIPAGMSLATASDGGVLADGMVVWTDLASLAPGAIKELAVGLRLDSVRHTSFKNVAEVAADGSGSVAAPLGPLPDADSTPGTKRSTDSDVERHDFDIVAPGDQQDDRDLAVLDMKKVALDNGMDLPTTGSDVHTVVRWALLFIGGGLALATVDARRRRHLWALHRALPRRRRSPAVRNTRPVRERMEPIAFDHLNSHG